MIKIDQAKIDAAFSYTAYRQLIDERLADGKTTGAFDSEAMLEYTRLNVGRMVRLDRKTTLTPELTVIVDQLDRPLYWLTITEGWCGDAAQSIPVIEKLAAASPHITTAYILRDEHLELMDQFLTNGGRSIPKLLVINPDTLEIIADWGPRPMGIQEDYLAARKTLTQLTDETEKKTFEKEMKTDIQRKYARGKTLEIQEELGELLKTLIN